MRLLGKWESVMYPTAAKGAYTLYANVERMRSLGQEIYPVQNQIFRALQVTAPGDVKVVILGQDPYHGVNEANGLAFSVNKGIAIPPSLCNIFQELEEDLGIPASSHGDLSYWAEQGVLLLNTSLTVEHGHPGSHSILGWSMVTKEVLNVCMEQTQCIVFVGWGAYAHSIISMLDFSGSANKYHLYSSHPSPLSAHKKLGLYPAFLGSRPFSKINKILTKNDSTEIDWNLDR